MAKKSMPKSAAPDAPVPEAPMASAKAKSTKPRVASPDPAPATQPLMVTEQMIAERAYHKWRNGEPGDPHHHWVSSERELRDNG